MTHDIDKLSPAEREQVIADLIIKNVVTKNENESTLTYGRMKLDLFFEENTCDVIIKDVVGGEKHEAEVTPLAIATKKIIEDRATETQQPISLEFWTMNAKLSRWASAFGAKISGWDSIEGEHEGSQMIFRKTIFPQQKST